MKEHALNEVEDKHVEDHVSKRNTLVESSIKEGEGNNASANGSENMSGEDKMRLLHCVSKDGVIEVYRKSQ